MMRSLYTAAAGMAAQQFNLDVIANNLANVNTNGFKHSRAEFQDTLYQVLRSQGAQNGQDATRPVALQVGLGSRTVATTTMLEQGPLQQTSNKYDLAIEGDGFFKVLLPDGSEAFTRDGQFKVDATGRIVTSDGYPLQPDILVPSDAISFTVGSDGTVNVQVAGDTTIQNLGQVLLARFPNPAGLQRIGHNLFRVSAASGDAIEGAPGTEGLGSIAQYAIENSNVQIVEEMVRMILAQRAYEVNSKAITTADEMLGLTNNLKR
ncbi:MAG: flagellar basal body rod protein FlgG [Fimbriimonadales bacterium]